MLGSIEDPNDKPPSSMSGPKNWSLAAYKEWVLEQSNKQAADLAQLYWTRDQWIESWRAYWKNPPAK